MLLPFSDSTLILRGLESLLSFLGREQKINDVRQVFSRRKCTSVLLLKDEQRVTPILLLRIVVVVFISRKIRFLSRRPVSFYRISMNKKIFSIFFKFLYFFGFFRCDQTYGTGTRKSSVRKFNGILDLHLG